jgi:hypothetical protein
MEDWTPGEGDAYLVRSLLNMAAANVYSRVPHPKPRPDEGWPDHFLNDLRRAFGKHRPDVDVTEDVDLGRAIEELTRYWFRDQV